MTTAPRGGGLRSMGASLLDQVLAETLDPAYVQAAQAREARERAAAAAGEPTAGRRRRSWGQVLVALVLAAAGLLAAMTYDQASAGAKGRHAVREALLGDIDRETSTADALSAQLDRLHGEVDRTRGAALEASAVGQDALDQLTAAENAAAALPVTGPGLLVTLANATPNADSDPVGGNATANSGGVVRDSDLQLVANALWAAGAEAVSIDGQRLGPTTTIRLAGEAVLVDFWPVTNPYKVSAVGDPDALATKFLADPGVQSLAVVSQSYGLRFDFAKQNHLALPPATPSELHFAQPLIASGSAASGSAVSNSAVSGSAGPTAASAPTGPPARGSAASRGATGSATPTTGRASRPSATASSTAPRTGG